MQELQLFDRCGPEDFMMDLCDYQNKTFSSDKVDDNYHTGEFGAGVHVSSIFCFFSLNSYNCFCFSFCANLVHLSIPVCFSSPPPPLDEFPPNFKDFLQERSILFPMSYHHDRPGFHCGLLNNNEMGPYTKQNSSTSFHSDPLVSSHDPPPLPLREPSAWKLAEFSFCFPRCYASRKFLHRSGCQGFGFYQSVSFSELLIISHFVCFLSDARMIMSDLDRSPSCTLIHNFKKRWQECFGCDSLHWWFLYIIDEQIKASERLVTFQSFECLLVMFLIFILERIYPAHTCIDNKISINYIYVWYQSPCWSFRSKSCHGCHCWAFAGNYCGGNRGIVASKLKYD